MDLEHQKLTTQLQSKVEGLISLYKSEREKNAELLKKLAEYQLSLSSSNEEIKELKSKYENLRLAGALIAEADRNPAEARQRLNKIIREIDQCIALLNK